MITTRHKEKTLSQLIKELDTVFSLFIRLRDSNDQGTVICFVSGEKVYYKEAQAAHWIPRANMVMRFCEQNVHACTKESNQYDPQHDDKYILKMLGFYGKNIVDDLIRRAQGLQKWTRPEIQEMIEDYSIKVANLRRIKGL